MFAHVVGFRNAFRISEPTDLQALDAVTNVRISLSVDVPIWERKTVLSRMFPPEVSSFPLVAAGLRCFPERVLAASQVRNLPKSETDLLESEATCTFLPHPLDRLRRRLKCCGASIAGEEPCAARDPELMFCLTGQQLSRRIAKSTPGGRWSRPALPSQTEISVALS